MRLSKKDYDNEKYDIPEDNIRGLVWAYGLRVSGAAAAAAAVHSG